MPLRTDELAVLRTIRHHVDSQYNFPIQAVPIRALHLEFRALRERGYVEKISSTQFQITQKGREALHAAALADEQTQQLLHQREQEMAEQRAYEDAKSCEERAHLHQQTKEQFRHDWRITAVNLLGGFILGAVADHFFDIVGNTTRTVFAVLVALGLVH